MLHYGWYRTVGGGGITIIIIIICLFFGSKILSSGANFAGGFSSSGAPNIVRKSWYKETNESKQQAHIEQIAYCARMKPQFIGKQFSEQIPSERNRSYKMMLDDYNRDHSSNNAFLRNELGVLATPSSPRDTVNQES